MYSTISSVCSVVSMMFGIKPADIPQAVRALYKQFFS